MAAGIAVLKRLIEPLTRYAGQMLQCNNCGKEPLFGDSLEPSGMGRVRNVRRFGGWLALFALALQLTLSFGHVHAEDFAPQAPVAGVAAGHSETHNPGSTGRDHDDCPICQTIYLLATLVMPLPPMVALLLEHPSAIVTNPGDRYLASAEPPRLFQARAPPQA